MVRDWLVIEAEGTIGILAASLLAGYLGILSSIVLLARILPTTKLNHSEADVEKLSRTNRLDKAK
jgi:hypothetical protein